ncbi:pyridoxamine 5'-phosphate oxidase family protein [Agarivorans sp. DSG3-1]|uniref:pyridoxamine 5'-phosphate oxidase family protein n=1 Tax=Agarivorans sp. DSG3-1 TaxID=3342249 RepID=UPI00398E92B7
MGVFHQGELVVQARAGVKEHIGPIGDKFIRDFMPDQHRDFFSQQALLYAGLLDNEGHPWASPILGEQGFISSPNAQTLSIEARALIEYSGLASLSAGDSLALLGLELNTRRRNRANGLISYASDHLLRFEVEQSFGNCPKYIQKRELQLDAFAGLKAPRVTDFKKLASNDLVLKQHLEQCDTFFIASRAVIKGQAESGGVDVSHRGGKPGFVALLKQTNSPKQRLIFPDFSGNNFFNTLGNIVADSRVGLYIPDFETGCGFWIKGHAEILWGETEEFNYEGAQRYVQVNIEQCLRLDIATLVQSSDVEYSPALDF